MRVHCKRPGGGVVGSKVRPDFGNEVFFMKTHPTAKRDVDNHRDLCAFHELGTHFSCQELCAW